MSSDGKAGVYHNPGKISSRRTAARLPHRRGDGLSAPANDV